MKRNMNAFWRFPETWKEKAEHQRMRREWAKIQQQGYNSSQTSNGFKKSSNSKWVVCLCSVFIFASWMFNNAENIRFKRFSENKMDVSEIGSRLSVGKTVSYSTNSYLEQGKRCTLRWNELSLVIKGDCKVFNAYSNELDLLLKEIELLNEKSISKYDELKSYEGVCEAYFGCIYSFFTTVKEQQFISIDAYNYFLSVLNSLETPYDHLVKLFDEHGYYYYIDSDKKVHYKVS